MANVALERALVSDEGYGLAQLLRGALGACMHPAELRAMVATTLDRLENARPAG